MNRWNALLVLALVAGCSKSQKPAASGGLEQAKQLYAQGQYAAAIAECDKAIAAGDQVAQAHLLRGKCNEATGADATAIADYGKARGSDAQLVEAYCRESRLHVKGMQVQQARGVMDAASVVSSSFGPTERFYYLAMQGEVHLAAQSPDPARKALKEAIEVAGGREDLAVAYAQYNLSLAHFHMAAFKSARASYEKYLAIKERTGAEPDADDRYTEMVLRMLTGDLQGAREIAQKLPEERKPQAEALLAGDALSVRELFEPAKNSDRR